MNFLVYIFGFLTLIIIITAIHEAGHYSMARFFKVTILDFSIGMGKSLKSWKDKANTEFHLRMLPIGGFVKMKGEDESRDAEDSFSSKKYRNFKFIQRCFVLTTQASNLVIILLSLNGL